MSTNFKAKHKKLYFDVTMGTTWTNAAFPCTQITNGTPGDRYGNLMAALPALTGSASPSVKAQNSVCAWFQPNSAGVTAAAPWAADFIQATATMVRGPQGTLAGVHALRYLTVGNTAVAQFSGHDAIYSVAGAGAPLHFAVRLRRRGTALCTVSGTLYVQRQHSIEV